MSDEPVVVIISAVQALVLAVWGVLLAVGVVDGDITNTVAVLAQAVLSIFGAFYARSKVMPV